MNEWHVRMAFKVLPITCIRWPSFIIFTSCTLFDVQRLTFYEMFVLLVKWFYLWSHQKCIDHRRPFIFCVLLKSLFCHSTHKWFMTSVHYFDGWRFLHFGFYRLRVQTITSQLRENRLLAIWNKIAMLSFLPLWECNEKKRRNIHLESVLQSTTTIGTTIAAILPDKKKMILYYQRLSFFFRLQRKSINSAFFSACVCI